MILLKHCLFTCLFYNSFTFQKMSANWFEQIIGCLLFANLKKAQLFKQDKKVNLLKIHH